MAEQQQGLADGEVGVAGGAAGAYEEEVSTEAEEEELYLPDPGCSCPVCSCTVCSGTVCSCTVCSCTVCSCTVCSCTVCCGLTPLSRVW